MLLNLFYYMNVDFINKKDNSNAFVGTAVESPTNTF